MYQLATLLAFSLLARTSYAQLPGATVASQRCRILRSGNRNLKPDHWSGRRIYTQDLTQARKSTFGESNRRERTRIPLRSGF
jgi:hypothetical protein